MVVSHIAYLQVRNHPFMPAWKYANMEIKLHPHKPTGNHISGKMPPFHGVLEVSWRGTILTYQHGTLLTCWQAIILV
jgi:hypothetical protein